MIRIDARWLRKLADLVESGEVEVGRVDINTGGVLLGTFVPGTFANKEMESEIRRQLGPRPRPLPRIKSPAIAKGKEGSGE